jgi:hypothetical protein
VLWRAGYAAAHFLTGSFTAGLALVAAIGELRGPLYMTIIALWGIALATDEVDIARGFKLLHAWRGPARRNQHT